jgi:hypothetical protein
MSNSGSNLFNADSGATTITDTIIANQATGISCSESSEYTHYQGDTNDLNNDFNSLLLS